MRRAAIAPVLGGVGGIVGNILFVVIGGIAGRGELFALHNIQVIVVAAVYDRARRLRRVPVRAVGRPD